MTEGDSRFAQLATELIGAKAAAEFLREAWAMADDETKRELASAVVDRVRKLIEKDSSFHFQDVMKDIVQSLIENEVAAEIERRREEDKELIEARVRISLDRFVDQSVDSIVKKAVVEICDKVRDSVSSALRGVR